MIPKLWIAIKRLIGREKNVLVKEHELKKYYYYYSIIVSRFQNNKSVGLFDLMVEIYFYILCI